MTSSEVNDAIGEAPTRDSATDQLAAKRAELGDVEARLVVAEQALDVAATVRLRETAAVLKDFIARLEPQAAVEHEAKAVTAAKARMAEIGGNQPGRVVEYHSTGKRIEAAARALAREVEAANALLLQFAVEYRETWALADRFGIGLPPLTRPDLFDVPQIRLPGLVDYQPIAPDIETDDVGRRRRSYGEIAGSASHAIIMAAGLKPFPPLTDKQRRAIKNADAKVEGFLKPDAMADEVRAAEAGARLGAGSVTDETTGMRL